MPTPDQKRQAIFTAASEGKVIEVNHHYDGWRKCDPFAHGTRLKVLKHPELYRIAPDPIAPGHNKFKLTTSVVGEGFRLVEESEGLGSDHSKKWWEALEYWSFGWCRCLGPARWHASDTLRTRLSVEALAALDKPEEKPNPGQLMTLEETLAETRRKLVYAEQHLGYLAKAMRMEGTTWSYLVSEANRVIFGYVPPPGPPKPAWRLPDPPAGGPPWHRDDFTEADLPEGWRPLLNGEIALSGDQYKVNRNDSWTTQRHNDLDEDQSTKGFFVRTRRPLPAIPRIRPWTFEEAPLSLKIIRKSDSAKATAYLDADGYQVWDGIISEDCDSYSFEQMLNLFTQLDGSPCGAKCETTEAE